MDLRAENRQVRHPLSDGYIKANQVVSSYVSKQGTFFFVETPNELDQRATSGVYVWNNTLFTCEIILPSLLMAQRT